MSADTFADASADFILLNDFSYHLVAGKDAWNRPHVKQPVTLSIHVGHDIQTASIDDEVATTLDYDRFYQEITAALTTRTAPFARLLDLTPTILACHPNADKTNMADPLHKIPYSLVIKLPKGVLRAEKGLTLTQSRTGAQQEGEGLLLVRSLLLEEISCMCVIGANKYERATKQPVILDLEFRQQGQTVGTQAGNVIKALGCYQDLVKAVTDLTDASVFCTVESLATMIARTIILDFDIETVTVSVKKPSAMASVNVAGVKITRNKAWFESRQGVAFDTIQVKKGVQ